MAAGRAPARRRDGHRPARAVLLGILTADCAPVLFADPEAGVVGAAHAGWRGALAGVTDATIAAMEQLGARRERIAAAVGPCIAQPSYEVDEAFRARFLDDDPANERFFVDGPRGQAALRPRSLCRRSPRTPRASPSVEALGLDTYADPDRFYSYRRATHRGEADYGRQVSLIGLAGQIQLERFADEGPSASRDVKEIIQCPPKTKSAPHLAAPPPRPSPTSIGNHKLKPQTLMLGYGFDPELSEGSLKPPIFLTSTFVFENAAAGKRFFEGVTGKRPGGAEGLIYSRFNGPNQEILEDRLAVWEDADDALAFSSGMSAIATLLLTFVQPGDVRRPFRPALCGDRNADRQDPRPVRRLVDRLSRRARRARKSTRPSPRAKEKGACRLIYLESPANPTNALVDVEAVAAARDAAFGTDERPPIAIDNTFLGPLWAKPLAAGRRPQRLQPDQICRRPQRPRRRRPGRRARR